LATGLVGMAKKDICPIEAEATRKNHRHPMGVQCLRIPAKCARSAD
jgi:hypothetical protein